MSYTNGLDKPSDYFNSVLWTGTGSSLANTGVGFQPDLTWIKGRSGATEHVLTDSVRGVTKELSSNDNGLEETVAQGLTAFGTDGFTVGTDGSYNTSSATYASWNWKKSATSGFDIVTATGTGSAKTIAHSLSAVPHVMISKEKSGSINDWTVYHHKNTAAPETDSLILNETNVTADQNTHWNDTAPTSSVFTVGTGSVVNRNSSTYVYYLFAEKQGYSKFGSYTGNGSADGTFVYTGFKPAFIMWKGTASTQNWMLVDNKRDVSNLGNGLNDVAFPNSSQAANDGETFLDVLSNGFKIRTTETGVNASGEVHIYMAFAENPFVTSTGVPATAR